MLRFRLRNENERSLLSQRGFTVIELISVMAIAGILSAIAVMNLKALSNTSENAAAELASLMKQARARAITSTSAYFVSPQNAARVVTRVGNNCSDSAPVADPLLTLNFPSGASLASTAWTVCFTSRGLSDSNVSIVVNDIYSQSRTVDVLLGGGIRVE